MSKRRSVGEYGFILHAIVACVLLLRQNVSLKFDEYRTRQRWYIWKGVSLADTLVDIVLQDGRHCFPVDIRYADLIGCDHINGLDNPQNGNIQ